MRIQVPQQVHHAGAIGAQHRAAVELVNGLHAVFLADLREPSQRMPSGVHQGPVVVAGLEGKEAELHTRHPGSRAAGVQRFDARGVGIDPGDGGGCQRSVESLLPPDAGGPRQRGFGVARIDRVAGPYVDVNAVEAQRAGLVAEFCDAQGMEELGVEHDLHIVCHPTRKEAGIVAPSPLEGEGWGEEEI